VNEKRQILILVAATFIIGIVALAAVISFPSPEADDLVAESYNAIWYEDGTLVEEYTYDVKSGGQYRMLFRQWDYYLTFEKSTDIPSIEFISMDVPKGTVGYAKDYQNQVKLFDENSGTYRSFISDQAYKNEVGIYRPEYFDKGK